LSTATSLGQKARGLCLLGVIAVGCSSGTVSGMKAPGMPDAGADGWQHATPGPDSGSAEHTPMDGGADAATVAMTIEDAATAADAAPTRCGDGVVVATVEDCDDGNTTAGDGCSAGCRREEGWACPTANAPCVTVCGDRLVVGHEACDDGDTITDPCRYGETSCTVCLGTCQMGPGLPTLCGDGTTDTANGEQCDDANAVTESCSYGQASCSVCSSACLSTPGAVSYCGDGTIDAANGEQCDDGNAVTETCSYGTLACTVCDSLCHTSVGAVAFCGDSVVDAAHGETCDDGNTLTEVCTYNAMSCSVCSSGCATVSGATSYCGDGKIDAAHGEQCDDHNTTPGDGCNATCHVEYAASCGNGVLDMAAGETCDDHNTNNLDGCSAACKIESGWTCPTVNMPCIATCGDAQVVGPEVCDDGNMIDSDYCSNNCRTKRSCGDSAIQASAGEQCDDGNTLTEACAYGLMSCTVCNASCKNAAGAVSYCGDGIVQSASGEECEPSSDIRCSSNCKLQCDTVYITYNMTGNVQLTNTTLGLGDGTFPQTGGKLVVALPAGPAGPIAGAGGFVYMRYPLSFTQTINFSGTTTIVTNIVGTSSVCTGASPGTCVPAPDASNRCPLDSGTLVLNAASGAFPNLMSWGACPYGANHGTVNWTPTDQQVAKGQGPGCLEYNCQGTIVCNGALCGTAGLNSGTNNVNDQWDQPGSTFELSADFKSVRGRGLGLNNGSGNPADKFETPERVNARTWLNFTGTEASRSCEMKPSNCRAPGSY
jgi:cysteine-rich repeat protein